MTSEEITPAVPAFDCEQSVRRLWDYLDGELGVTEVAALEAHLAECDRCPPHFTFERRFLEIVREAKADIVPTVTPSDLRERVVRCLQQAGELSSGGGAL